MLILIHGEDTYSSRQYLENIISQFKQKHDPTGTAVLVFDAAECEWEQVCDALSADGLFSSKKLVVCKGLLSNKPHRESLGAFLAGVGLSESSTLVAFEAGAVDKRTAVAKKMLKEKYSREFFVADSAALERMMANHARELGKTIAPDALRLLSGIAGTDVWRARSEISKLSHLGGGAITADDVRAHTHASLEEELWQFLDSLGSGNKAHALGLLEQQFSQGVEPMYLLSMLIRQVRLLIALFGAQGTDSMLASNLSLHPFVVKKTRQQSRRFSLAQLVAMYHALARLDGALKSGRGEPKALFTVLVDSIVR